MARKKGEPKNSLPLSPKQKKFCEEYVIDLNGAKAAIRAGYSKHAAREIASRMLTKANIKAYVASLKAKLQEKACITAEMVVNELAKIGFSNIQSFISQGNTTEDISEVEPAKAAAVSSIKVITTTGGAEGKKWTKESVEFKLHDKVSALEKLGRHLGIFEKDNAQIAIPKPESYTLPDGTVIKF